MQYMIMNSGSRRGFRLLILLLIALFTANVSAQTPLSEKEGRKRVKEIVGTYPQWTTAEWQGKVKSDMLPVALTAKVFLKRDQLILISLRAPLLGEVARVEVDPQSVLLINKMKRRYWKREISDIDTRMPGSFECLQSLLLGRAFIIGQGELSETSGQYAGYYTMDEDITFIAPMIPVEIENFNYGFAINGAGQMINIIMQYAETEFQNEDIISSAQSGDDYNRLTSGSEEKIKNYDFSAQITPANSGSNVQATMIAQQMKVNLNIEGIKIVWGGNGFARLNLTSNYQSTTLSQCLRF